MEQKADRMLDEANAMAELNKSGDDELDSLIDKYDSPDSSVEDELNKLKASLNDDIDDELNKMKEEMDK